MRSTVLVIFSYYCFVLLVYIVGDSVLPVALLTLKRNINICKKVRNKKAHRLIVYTFLCFICFGIRHVAVPNFLI